MLFRMSKDARAPRRAPQKKRARKPQDERLVFPKPHAYPEASMTHEAGLLCWCEPEFIGVDRATDNLIYEHREPLRS